MKIKDKSNKKIKTFFGALAVFLSIVLGWALSLNPKSISDVNVQLSLFAMEKGYQGVTRINSGEIDYSPKDYLLKIIKSPKNLKDAEFGTLETLIIDLPFDSEALLNKEIEKIKLLDGISQRSEKEVSGSIRTYNGSTLKVKLSLKGQALDHVQYKNKESMRIEVENGSYNGMTEFSLQHPLVRDFQLEPVFMEVTNNYGILSTNYKLIKVVINGRSRGIFEIEEVGTKEHIERSGRRNSVVLRLQVDPDQNLNIAKISDSGLPETYRTAAIDTLNTSQIIKDPLLNEYKKISTSLLRSYLDGQISASEAFDTKLMGRYLGIIEVFGSLHPAIYRNMLFYYNPLTGLLEPLAYDASLFQRYGKNTVIRNLTDGLFEELLNDEEIFEEYYKTISDFSLKLVEGGSLYNSLVEIDKNWHSKLLQEYWLLGSIDFKEIRTRANELIKKPKTIFAKRSNRILPAFESRKYFCENPQTITINKLNENFEDVNNPEYDLIHSENFIVENCRVIKIWSSAFDNAASSKKIKLIAIELKSDDKSTFYSVDNEVSIEQNLFLDEFNSVLPSVPDYLEIYTGDIESDLVNIYFINPVNNKLDIIKSNNITKPFGNSYLKEICFNVCNTYDENQVILEGNLKFENSIFLHKGQKLKILPGTNLEFSDDSGIFGYGSIDISGTKDNIITLDAISGSWRGIHLYNHEKNNLKNAKVSNTFPREIDYFRTGGISIIGGVVDVENFVVENNGFEDAINLVDASFSIINLKVSNTTSDAIDIDNGEGVLESSSFFCVGTGIEGGDAIDVSFTNINLVNIDIVKVADKAISIGENSTVEIMNININNATSALAVKDGSKAYINDDLVIENSTYDILGFVKKDEFKHPTIEFLNVKNFEKFKLLISENTITNLEKFDIRSNTFFDSLYEKEYKLDCN